MVIPDPVLVAYSGGKDSLVVLDLCVRAGCDVEAFFMYFLPGLDYTEHWCSLAERRWGIRVHRILHWNTPYYLRNGLFCEPDQDVSLLTILDIEAKMREQTGREWIGYGYKSIDSLQRRGMMNRWVDGRDEQRRIFSPIKTWNNSDVRSYLSRRRIPIPGSIDGKRSSGISLTPECMAWLRNEWPADYRRILKVFPYAQGQADRAVAIRERKDRNAALRVPRDQPDANQPCAV